MGENIDHKCDYCELYFHLKKLDQHESKCKHRPVKCPQWKCEAMVSLPKLKDHLVNGCVEVAEINEVTMPRIFDYFWDASVALDLERTFVLHAMYFEKKLFFLKSIVRPLQGEGRHRWILYVQMAGRIEETSKFGVNITVFRKGDSRGEGKYCHRYSGEICPIDVTSVDEVE